MERRSLCFGLAALAMAAISLASPAGGLPASIPPTDLYAADSPFNTPIPDGAALHPNSKAMVRGMVDAASGGRFVLAVKRYSIPVYFAGANTQRVRVKFTAGWAPKDAMLDVPVPKGTKPDPGSDGSVAIIDRSTGCEYDFWRFEKTSTGYRAAWGNALPTSSSGVFPKGLSARGSGMSLLAGVIWPDELEAQVIDHALLFIDPYTAKAGAVPPATETDGMTRDPWAIPEGARVRLDPTLNLDRLGLTPYERTIAEALQTYGMYLGDDGGGLALQAINPLSSSGDPYSGLLPDRRYVSLNGIPVNRFQVLDFPEPTPASEMDIRIVPNACAEFR